MHKATRLILGKLFYNKILSKCRKIGTCFYSTFSFFNKNKMTVIENYVKYWDDWHSDWFKNIKLNPEKIKEWKVPCDKGGNDNPICQYFPEPYWGNPYSEKLSGIFLNINPGGGGASQDILTMDLDDSNPYKAYKTNKNLYSNTVKELSAITDYKTTEWMQKWRVNWIREILDNKLINVTNIFCAELIPWHTKKKSDISDYAVKYNTPNLINTNVISHLTKIAQSESVVEEMKGKVIVRSSLLLDILNAIHKINSTSIKISDIENYAIIDNIKDKNNNEKLLSKFNSYLTIFKIDNTSFYVFSGGSNSVLPNPAFTVFHIGQNISNRKTGISLKEFMKS